MRREHPLKNPYSTKPPPTTPLLMPNEVCSLLRICSKTLRKLTESKSIPSVKIGGSARYRWSDIHRIIDGGESKPSQPETTP